jgi:hypothetical protein
MVKAEMSTAALESAAGGSRTREKGERVKFSIAMSADSDRIFRELKKWTDADTDSEVFRNALRIHYLLLEAEKSGALLEVVNSATGARSLLKLSLVRGS